MKWRIIIAFILVFFTSCEKRGNEDDTILKFFSAAYKDTGNSIAIGEDCYYMCGQITESQISKAGIIKASFEGKIIGEPVTYSGRLTGSASKVIVLTDGTILCTGFVVDSVSNEKDIIVVHAQSDLSLIAQKIYEVQGNQYGVDIVETSEGFLILGTTDVAREPFGAVTGNAAGKKDILLMRINKNLEMLAPIPAVGFIGNDEGVAIKLDLNGGYMVVGTTDRSDRLASEQSGNNIFLLRVNSDGSTTQPRIVGDTRNEAASDFEVLSDGYLIAGTTGNAGTTQQGFIWKMPIDIYDDPEVEEQIKLDPPCSIKAMCRYKSNYFLLAGQHGTGLSARLIVFTVNAFGDMVEGQIKETGGNGTQIANDVITDESDNIITIGNNSYEDNSMIFFLKFRF
jgi:hypothetical protein